jgi:hypothetical protein
MIRGVAMTDPCADVALHHLGHVQHGAKASTQLLKCFILLHFSRLRQCHAARLVHCTKISLTARRALPRMKLLRRTIAAGPTQETS